MALPYATENQLKEISKRIKNIIENKQDKLIEGENISIKDNVISARSPIKVYDWELEEDEATGNIYVKDPDAYNNIEKLISENTLINLYFPNEDFKSGKIYLGHFFMSYGLGGRDQTAIDLGYLAGNTVAGGSPNDIYHIYLIGDEEKQKLKYNLVKVETGGSSEIPTLSTIAPSMSDLATTVYSDDDIALIKKQKDNFIKVPFGTAENNTSELCYVFSLNNAYSLIDVAGSMLSIVSAFSESPTFLYFNLDETNKKLVGESYSALSATDTSLYVLSSDNQIYLTNQLKSGVGQALNKSYYCDKINGKSIIHEDSTINNYTIPTITFED